MLIDSSKMSMIDISRFVNEAKISREYKDFIIETESYNFTQRLDIGHKADGNHIIQSYVEGTNSEGFNNCVGLTYPEMKAVMKKFRELKRKYRW